MRFHSTLLRLCVIFCAATTLLAAESDAKNEVDARLKSFPPTLVSELSAALNRAGTNKTPLLNVAAKLEQIAPGEQLLNAQKAYAFLVSNMPEKDLASPNEDVLLNTIQWALKARANAPWSAAVPDDVFFNDVLPYASVDEPREDWRKDFYERFADRAWKLPNTGEAARWLNRTIFPELKVRYDQSRSTVNASPSISMKEGKATCTGLSILLIDACRACGIPARLAGIPSWKTPNADAAGNHGGNHNWVEVWNEGGWHCIGASEDSELDHTWFLAKAKDAVDGSQWEHAVYASSWKATDTNFPLVWNLKDASVPALNVSERYVPKK